MSTPDSPSSRHISKINFDLATIYGIKISLVAELRRKLKNLLFELDQSSPLSEETCKVLIQEILFQPATTNEKKNSSKGSKTWKSSETQNFHQGQITP